jgi:hypothetical protein
VRSARQLNRTARQPELDHSNEILRHRARDLSALVSHGVPRSRGVSVQVLALQRSAGNAAVGRLLRPADLDAPAADVEAEHLSTGLAEAPTSSVSAAWPIEVRIPRRDPDAPPGAEMTPVPPPSEVSQALLNSAGPIPESAPGQAAKLPDMVMPESVVPAETDSVAGALTYAPSVARSGNVNPFGSTSWSKFSLTGITVTPTPGAYQVAATVQNPITYNVNPGGRTSIASENDSALSAKNYQKAASDLTPNMGDLNGRPPRKQFWAEDLTLRHEGFHANERQTFNGQGTAAAQTWLGTQTATGVPAVQSLLAQVPNQIINYSQAHMAMPGKEQRAYGDGAPAYLARANAIKAKGDKGDYPRHTGVGARGGAAAGAGIGAVVGGPVGAAVGGVVGAVAGGIAGYFL